jgi:hypothetical protein
VDRSDTAAAPPTVIALANGRCFHLPGCQYTMKRTAQNTRVIKPGVLSYKRCDVCMPHIGKHWGHKPTKLSASEQWERRKLSASADVRGMASGLSASAEVQSDVPELSASAEAHGQAPGSSYDVPAPRRPPRMTPEVRGRPDPWPVWPASYAIVQWTALLVDAEIPSETILQFVGAHFDENFKWSRRGHWRGIGCGQSCGCCRSSNEEDFASGCISCNALWDLKCVSRSTVWRVSIFNGLASRWQWE